MTVVSLDVVGARAEALRGAARRVHVGRALLTVLAAVLFAAGWVAGKAAVVLSSTVRRAWFGVSWCAAAVAVGWSQARARREVS